MLPTANLDVLFRSVYSRPDWLEVMMETWTAERDVLGRWRVVRTQGWCCVVVPSGDGSTTDREAEDRARSMARALNRVYAR